MNAHLQHKAVMRQVRAEEAAARSAYEASQDRLAGGPKRCIHCGEPFARRRDEWPQHFRERQACKVSCKWEGRGSIR
jgi:hypothetical protein